MTEPKKATSVAASGPLRGALTPFRCAKFVRQRMASRLPEICEGLLTKAEKGDLAAVKVLLQMAALDKGEPKEALAEIPLTKQMAFVRKTLAEFRQDRSG